MKCLQQIVGEYLREHGYDGLCTDDCGCSIDDLGLCEESMSNCVPAYKHVNANCEDCGIECDSAGEKNRICYRTDPPVKTGESMQSSEAGTPLKSGSDALNVPRTDRVSRVDREARPDAQHSQAEIPEWPDAI